MHAKKPPKASLKNAAATRTSGEKTQALNPPRKRSTKRGWKRAIEKPPSAMKNAEEVVPKDAKGSSPEKRLQEGENSTKEALGAAFLARGQPPATNARRGGIAKEGGGDRVKGGATK